MSDKPPLSALIAQLFNNFLNTKLFLLSQQNIHQPISGWKLRTTGLNFLQQIIHILNSMTKHDDNLMFMRMYISLNWQTLCLLSKLTDSMFTKQICELKTKIFISVTFNESFFWSFFLV